MPSSKSNYNDPLVRASCRAMVKDRRTTAGHKGVCSIMVMARHGSHSPGTTPCMYVPPHPPWTMGGLVVDRTLWNGVIGSGQDIMEWGDWWWTGHYGMG